MPFGRARVVHSKWAGRSGGPRSPPAPARAPPPPHPTGVHEWGCPVCFMGAGQDNASMEGESSSTAWGLYVFI